MLPSVRGRERAIVGTILVGSGTAAGALVGLGAAVFLAPVAAALGPPPAGTTLTLVGAGTALDGLRLVVGHPAPPTAGRQVPRAWVWVFPARVTAGLYGARLGVGPLTILSTWTWWSFTLAAALLGPAAGALVGGAFGLVRLVVNAWVSLAAAPVGHARTFGLLRAGRRPGWAAITVVTAVLTLSIAGCGSSDRSAEPPDPVPTTAPGPPPDRSTGPTAAERAPAGDPTEHAGDPTGLISPAELEDVVRTSTPTPNLPTEPRTDRAAVGRTAEPAALAGSLLTAVPGFVPIGEPDADRYLDLEAAAAVQPDPTEEIALLETRGFRGGWMRAFRNDGNDVAVASVYQFEDPGEAEFYLEDGLITIGGYGGSFFDIPELPGVRGFVQEIASSDGESTEDLVSLGASFHRGDRWYLLYFLGSPETVTPELLVPAVTAQHRLAGA